MKTLLVLLLLLSGVACAKSAPVTADESAYDMGHELSLAVLGRARGANEKAVGNILKRAQGDAAALKVKIPALPKLSGKQNEDLAAGLHYLLQELGPTVKPLTKKQAALFEIGVKSNCVLMLYTPGNDMGVTGVLAARCKTAGLPATLTAPLAAAVKAKASQEEFTKLLKTFHDGVKASF